MRLESSRDDIGARMRRAFGEPGGPLHRYLALARVVVDECFDGDPTLVAAWDGRSVGLSALACRDDLPVS